MGQDLLTAAASGQVRHRPPKMRSSGGRIRNCSGSTHTPPTAAATDKAARPPHARPPISQFRRTCQPQHRTLQLWR